ncbi:MAG: antibiotic biosynthesis monooxygenase [Bacteroidetes bacterium]|nr:MAG: antibiotic biosynthesis monooxygenase [Bacteroidota bacterium]
MITRIVKMTFQPHLVAEFLIIFERVREDIRNFPGCKHLEMLVWTENKAVIFTLSRWESVEKLDEYRSSQLFKETWKKTKSLFSAPAEAWSLIDDTTKVDK